MDARAVNDPSPPTDIVNPRRSPRLRLCCPATVSSGGRAWKAHTEDVGPGGCQIVSTSSAPAGASVHLLMSSTAVADLSVSGTVVWASPAAPFRMGIAFSEQHAGVTSRWFDDLLRAGAGHTIDPFIRAIPAETMIFLGAPPRFCPDFTPDEAAIVLSLETGLRAGELRGRFRSSWSRVQHALFSLIARRVVTTSRADAVPVARWRVFHEYLLALTADRPPAPAAPIPVPAPARAPEAQSLYDAALVLIADGQLSSAILTLRAALARAPRDMEIASALVRAAMADTA